MKIGDTLYIAVKTENFNFHGRIENTPNNYFTDEVLIYDTTENSLNTVVNFLAKSVDGSFGYEITSDGKIYNIYGLTAWWRVSDYRICDTLEQAEDTVQQWRSGERPVDSDKPSFTLRYSEDGIRYQDIADIIRLPDFSYGKSEYELPPLPVCIEFTAKNTKKFRKSWKSITNRKLWFSIKLDGLDEVFAFSGTARELKVLERFGSEIIAEIVHDKIDGWQKERLFPCQKAFIDSMRVHNVKKRKKGLSTYTGYLCTCDVMDITIPFYDGNAERHALKVCGDLCEHMVDA